MKKIILLWLIKLVVFAGASTSPCSTQNCGEQEFIMKGPSYNIGSNMGDVHCKCKSECDLAPPTIAAPIHNCKEVFKPVSLSSVLNTQLNADSYALYDLQIETGDLIHCKIEEMDIPFGSSGYNQIGSDIHTIPQENAVFMTAPSSKCFSFEIRASNDAKIILKNTILNEDKIEIVLGANNNKDITYKVFRSECRHTIVNPPYAILNDYEFVNYWVCWRSGKVVLGTGDQIIIDENENIQIKDPIEYIGLQTTNSATGVWKVMESNCPGCYEAKVEGSNARVSCVKVQDTCT